LEHGIINYHILYYDCLKPRGGGFDLLNLLLGIYTYMAGDILSHPNRQKQIHILTLDTILADDIYDRIHNDPRMKKYRLINPFPYVADINKAARNTVSSKLLILDVRRQTLPQLQSTYNKVVGYNRRDLNRLCYIILIGDGPGFQVGKSLDCFVLYLANYRVEYSPAAFFYDPLLHYEPNEIPYVGIDEGFLIFAGLPKGLVPYFKGNSITTMNAVRRFLRATDKGQKVKTQRSQILTNIYRKWLSKNFIRHKNQVNALFSKEGLRLASEKFYLYPFFFEDWVHDLMEKPANKRHNCSFESDESYDYERPDIYWGF